MDILSTDANTICFLSLTLSLLLGLEPTLCPYHEIQRQIYTEGRKPPPTGIFREGLFLSSPVLNHTLNYTCVCRSVSVIFPRAPLLSVTLDHMEETMIDAWNNCRSSHLCGDLARRGLAVIGLHG